MDVVEVNCHPATQLPYCYSRTWKQKNKDSIKESPIFHLHGSSQHLKIYDQEIVHSYTYHTCFYVVWNVQQDTYDIYVIGGQGMADGLEGEWVL